MPLTYAQREVKMWDGTSMSEGDGLGFPSSLDGHPVPAVGPGTWYPWGMTLEQACRYFWRVRQADATLAVGEFSATVPAISIPDAHELESGEWVPAPISEPSFSAEITEWPALSDPSAAGKKMIRDFSYQVGTGNYALCPDDHFKSLLQQRSWLAILRETASGLQSNFTDDWKNAYGEPPETDVFYNGSAKAESAFDTNIVSEPVLYVAGKYWFPVPFLNLFCQSSVSVGWNDSEGSPKFASSTSFRYLKAGSDNYKLPFDRAQEMSAPEVTFRLKFSEAPGDFVEGEPFCVMTGQDDQSLGGAQDADLDAEVSLVGPVVLTISVEKWFTYGGIYDEDTGARV